MPVHDIGHPLVRHKIGLLREGDISTKKFREVTEEIARLLQLDAELIPVKSTDVKLKARRPVYCALSNEKLKAAGIGMPTWQEALKRYSSR